MIKKELSTLVFTPENASPLNELNPNESEKIKLVVSIFFK